MKIYALFLGALPAFCGLTSITGPLYTPAGDLFGGTITVTLNNPATAQPLYNSSGRTLTGFATTVRVTGGSLTLSLEANDAITPSGTSYTARFQPDSATGGGGWAETWVVPTSGTALLVHALRSTTVPIPALTWSPSQLSSGGATSGQYLRWSGTSWSPHTLSVLTDPTTTTGDILYRSSGGTLTRLGIGSASQVLTVSGGLPSWATPSGAVSSVFGRTGAITATSGDYTTAQVTESGNLYYTDARARAAITGSGAIGVSSGVVSCSTCVITSGSYADPSWITSLAGSKVSGAISGNAGTATALAANPADCTSGQYATAIADSGDLTCAQVAYSQVSGTPSLSGYVAGAGALTTVGVVPVVASSGALSSSLVTFDAADPISDGASLIVTNGGSAARLYSFDAGGGSGESGFLSTSPDGLTPQNFSIFGQQLGFGNLAFELMLTVGANGTTTVFNSTPATGETTLIVKAGEGQAGNLQEWQDASGTVRSSISGDGLVHNITDGIAAVQFGLDGDPFQQLNNATRYVFFAPSSFTAALSSDNSRTTFAFNFSTLTVQDTTATTGSTELVVKAGEGQSTNNLQTWRNAVGSTLSAITSAGTFTGNASTASALSANPTDCSAGQFANAIAASGNLTCAQVAYTDVSGKPTLATVATSGNASDLGSGTLAAARGGAGTVSGVLKANGSGVVSAAEAGTDYVAPAGNVATATAFAANGTNCSAGSYPLGVDASGNAESCTAASGSGTVTSVSVTPANGVSGSVATATSTPAITLTLGAITPASVAAVGAVTGSNLSGTNTGDQTTVSGNAGTATVLQTARLINGTSFNGSADITITANLPSNPTACTAGQYVSDIAADGTLTCGTPAGGSGTTQAQALTLVSFRF